MTGSIWFFIPIYCLYTFWADLKNQDKRLLIMKCSDIAVFFCPYTQKPFGCSTLYWWQWNRYNSEFIYTHALLTHATKSYGRFLFKYLILQRPPHITTRFAVSRNDNDFDFNWPWQSLLAFYLERSSRFKSLQLFIFTARFVVIEHVIFMCECEWSNWWK